MSRSACGSDATSEFRPFCIGIWLRRLGDDAGENDQSACEVRPLPVDIQSGAKEQAPSLQSRPRLVYIGLFDSLMGSIGTWPQMEFMQQYDPEQTPDAVEWLALDEQLRISLVEAYHRKARVKLPNITMHATIHAVVENQVAEGHKPVVRAQDRLTSAGLSRHDALHAIGSVLAEHLFEIFNGRSAGKNPMEKYDSVVERLTADGWRRG